MMSIGVTNHRPTFIMVALPTVLNISTNPATAENTEEVVI